MYFPFFCRSRMSKWSEETAAFPAKPHPKVGTLPVPSSFKWKKRLFFSRLSGKAASRTLGSTINNFKGGKSWLFLKRGGDTVRHKKLWRKGKEGENPEPSYLWVNEQQHQQRQTDTEANGGTSCCWHGIWLISIKKNMILLGSPWTFLLEYWWKKICLVNLPPVARILDGREEGRKKKRGNLHSPKIFGP